MIRKEKGKSTYRILSHDGKKVLGSGYSKKDAQKRLAQIEMFKHMKGKKK